MHVHYQYMYCTCVKHKENNIKFNSGWSKEEVLHVKNKGII